MSEKQHERHRRRFEERRRGGRAGLDDSSEDDDRAGAEDASPDDLDEDEVRRRAREDEGAHDDPDPFTPVDPGSKDRGVWDLYGRGRVDHRDEDPRARADRMAEAERERESLWERHRGRIRERQRQIERGERGERPGEREGPEDPEEDDLVSFFGGEGGRFFGAHGSIPYPGFLSSTLLTFASICATAFVSILFAGPAPIVAIGLGQVLGIGGVATLAARNVAEPQSERLGLTPIPRSLGPALLCLVPAVVVVSEVDNYLRDWFPDRKGLAERMSEQIPEAGNLFDLSSPLAAMQAMIVAVGLVPVVQEWLFRGVIQQGLVDAYGRVRGVVLAAFLYAIVHLPILGGGVDQVSPVVTAFLLGCVYGLARLATGSVLAPMLLSGAASAAGLIGMATADSMPLPGFNTIGEHTPLPIVLPCAILVGIGISGLMRALDERDAANATRSPSKKKEPR